MKSRKNGFFVALVALWCALIAAGAYLSIPFVPVPLVLANFFAVLGGLLFGPIVGGAAVLLYLVLGGLGLPVFAGGKAGFAQFMGPTGGFLVGYLAGAVLGGFLVGKRRDSMLRVAVAGLAAMAAVYAVGLPWFQEVLSTKVPNLWAAATFMAPYMVADLVKIAAAVAITRATAPVVERYLAGA